MTEDVAERTVEIVGEPDIVVARAQGRELAAGAGFSSTDQTLIATAISELARNTLSYAGRGEVSLSVIDRSGVPGLRVIARDSGPGIANPELAMRDGYSTARGPGVGLPGAKRLMDEFELVTAVGIGTTITMVKWTR